MISITGNNIRQSEECLYISKYLYGRIQELSIELEDIMPPQPGSILKVVGKPMAKTPLDTSQTESWGIIRATCRQAVELSAKEKLYKHLKELYVTLSKEESEFIRLKYFKEHNPQKTKELLDIDHQKYYTIRQRILRKTWAKVKHLEPILDIAVQ